MKKIILPALAMLLLGGITSAQVKQKQPVKTASVVVNRPATNVKSMNSTTAVTPVKTTKTTAKETAIKRKHHHKPKKAKKQ